jgi:hypothetical protein
MLKKVLITLSSILFATTVVAQGSPEGTYACQYVDGNGFVYEDGRWNRRYFDLKPPFFIKLGPDTLDPQSIYDGLNVGFSYELPTCFPEDFSGGYSCASQLGETAIFNPATREGAKTTIFGAGMSGEEYRDTLTIFTFVCQKV